MSLFNTKKLFGVGGLAAALVALVSINTISNATLRGVRADLTENKLYTISDGTRNILRNLEDPITVRFYFSEKIATRIPTYKAYGIRVRELLQEYAANSNGKLRLEIIDPEPFSDAEDRAVQAGMQGQPISRTESLFIGLEAVDSTDQQKTIPFLNLEREEFIQYDITQLIYNVANPQRKTIVVLSPLPVNGEDVDPMARMMGRAQGSDPWAIIQVLRQLYNVNVITPAAESLPSDSEMDMLLVIHPKDLSRNLQYQIDQYALRGGRVAVFVDPHAEVDQPPANPQNPLQSMMAPRGSDMPSVFERWGIEMIRNSVVADRTRAIEVPTGSQTNPRIVPFVVYMTMTRDDLNQQEIVTAQLDQIRLGMPGALRKLDNATTEIIPLIQSTADSQLIEVDKVRMFPDPEELRKNFTPTSDRYMLGVRISGKTTTAFPEGPADGDKLPNHVDESKAPLNVFVFSDVDMLSDRFWVQTQRLFGQTLMIPTAQNGNLLSNTMDFLGGSSDLASIRSLGRANRPFERIQEMQKRAEERHAAKLAELQKELEETEAELRKLQQAREDGGSLVLSEEQRARIQQFEERRVATRKELRNTELELRREIENLGSRLQLINIGLMPLLVGILAVGLGIYRSNRRRRR
jgi:ABC-type uncharacterized transport system involved in gliding motility auxiliary subunit